MVSKSCLLGPACFMICCILGDAHLQNFSFLRRPSMKFIFFFQLFWHWHISQEAWDSKLEIAYFLKLLSENSHSDLEFEDLGQNTGVSRILKKCELPNREFQNRVLQGLPVDKKVQQQMINKRGAVSKNVVSEESSIDIKFCAPWQESAKKEIKFQVCCRKSYHTVHLDELSPRKIKL